MRKRTQHELEYHREQHRSPAPYILRGDVCNRPIPPEAEPPALGSSKTFIPAANVGNGGGGDVQGILHRKITGTVVEIHREHRWYRVKYPMGESGCIGYECFKF